jgi:hypothetical protein
MTLPDNWLSLLVSVLVAVGASSGAWGFVMHYITKKEAKNDLLMGIAYDRIVTLGFKCIEDNYISDEDYELLVEKLYKPYLKRGGNGLAKRVIAQVETLRIVKGENPHDH